MKLFSNRRRPVHLGLYPFERLPRAPEPVPAMMALTPVPGADPPAPGLASIARRYLDAFLASDTIPVAKAQAPYPPSAVECSHEIKAACYFLDASAVGVCELRGTPDSPETGDGQFAVVLLVEHGREPESSNLAAGWVAGTAEACGAVRGVEIANVVAGYIRQWGWNADVHVQGPSPIDLAELARCAGVLELKDGGPMAPFIGRRFTIAAVVTSLPLEPDRPLAPGGSTLRGVLRLRLWLGIEDGESGL